MAEIYTVIDDKYEILKLIGQGGMSKVYLAMDKRLNKQWAVKEVQKNTRDKNNYIVVQSAIAEANLMKRLDHPALPRIVDIIEKEDLIYVIMDYVEGESLDKILDNYGAQPQDMVIEWAKQLCNVLDYLHNCVPPIIYRDMKPANIVLQPNGNIKLLDFGIAREYKEQNLQDTVSLGTKGYAAPEQFGGHGQTDARTDIYCLGVTLYHLVTGQNPSEPPYQLYPIRYWNPALSGGFEKVIQTCTQLNPEDRYQSSAELLYAIEHYDKFDDAYRKRQKSKLLAFTSIAAASVLLFAFGWFGVWMQTQTNNEDYDNSVQLAEKANSENEIEEYYMQAIKIKPSAFDAYYGLVKTYKDDASFSTQEEEQLKRNINNNLSLLKESPEYGNLAFEIGKLYWYYYDYGKSGDSDNQITRMKSSIQWFEDAIDYGSKTSDYYSMAVIYRDIGKFNQEITLNIEEASDNGHYKPYFDNVNNLLAMIVNNSQESEIVQLEVYRLSIFSVENYARKFKADGLSQKDIQKMLDAASRGVTETEATTDKTEEMRSNILDRIKVAQKSIDNAYSVG